MDSASQPPSNPANVLAYASPATIYTDQIFRDHEVLVIPKNAQLPPLCARCNSPTDESGRYRRTNSWHAQWVYLLLLLAGPLIYILVAMFVRKSATYWVYLCPLHRAKRRNTILISWALVLGGIGMIVAAIAYNQPFLAFAGIFLSLIAGVVGLVRARIFTPKKIDDSYAYLTGACSAFLDNFPSSTT